MKFAFGDSAFCLYDCECKGFLFNLDCSANEQHVNWAEVILKPVIISFTCIVKGDFFQLPVTAIFFSGDCIFFLKIFGRCFMLFVTIIIFRAYGYKVYIVFYHFSLSSACGQVSILSWVTWGQVLA